MQGKWQSKFDAASIKPEPFTKLDGTTTSVPTMTQMRKFELIQGPRVTAIRLPYIVRLFPLTKTAQAFHFVPDYIYRP